MKLDNTIAQMRKGLLELCVLSIISGEEMYPSDIIGKLKDQKMIIVEGTLYPMLTRLKNDGLLDYDWKESKTGPPRKYYKITDQGKSIRDELINTWQELSNSVNSTISEIKK
ncbi:MAG: PadR family transcriptional regulator [Saprospiraceae bacterium]|jgi:PadR family transcriptional regulator PadR